MDALTAGLLDGLKFIRFSLSTAFPVGFFFFASVLCSQIGNFFCVYYILTFEKINTGFVELSLIHFS